MLTVSPRVASTRIPVRKEPGIAIPTRNPERSPSAATTMTSTSRIALVTLFSRSLSMVRMSSDRSCENRTSTPGGQWARSASTARRTALVVSMMFSPTRFDTSRLSAGLPLTRAMVTWSLNVRRTEAMSRTVIALSPETLSGMFSRSDSDSKSPGTLTANRPRPVSSCPAATRVFDRDTIRSTCPASIS